MQRSAIRERTRNLRSWIPFHSIQATLLVERFFRDVTDRIADGSFASVKELSDTIIGYLADRNQNPKRYVWKAKSEEILRKIQRAREIMAQKQAVA